MNFENACGVKNDHRLPPVHETYRYVEGEIEAE
jgi:hypothetical protein